MPKLMEKLVLGRNPDMGAPTAIITGRIGGGKTSLLCDIARKILDKKKDKDRPQNERLFWKGQESCQFLKLHKIVPYNIFIPELTQVDFFSPNGMNLKAKKFSTFQELYEMADPDCLNVVYFSFQEITEFMEWLQKTKFDWNSILIDEVEDLCPFGSATRWKSNYWVSNILKEARKYYLSFYSTTQSISDVDWRVRTKILASIFLTGATTMKVSPVWKSAVQGLKIGQGWVSIGGNYEKFSFPPYPTKIHVKARIKYGQKNVTIPGEAEEENA